MDITQEDMEYCVKHAVNYVVGDECPVCNPNQYYTRDDALNEIGLQLKSDLERHDRGFEAIQEETNEHANVVLNYVPRAVLANWIDTLLKS